MKNIYIDKNVLMYRNRGLIYFSFIFAGNIYYILCCKRGLTSVFHLKKTVVLENDRFFYRFNNDGQP